MFQYICRNSPWQPQNKSNKAWAPRWAFPGLRDGCNILSPHDGNSEPVRHWLFTSIDLLHHHYLLNIVTCSKVRADASALSYWLLCYECINLGNSWFILDVSFHFAVCFCWTIKYYNKSDMSSRNEKHRLYNVWQRIVSFSLADHQRRFGIKTS